MATTPPPDDDVEKILTRMMAQNSGLMKGARTQGLQQAQAAGLGQSTMGIKAAQAAAYNAAVPLASQQASQGFQQKQQEAQFGQQTKMQTSQFGHETGMQQRGFQHASSESALDRSHQGTLQDRAAYLDRLKMHEQFAVTLPFEAQQNAAQRSMQERLASMEISAAERARALEGLSQNNAAWGQTISQLTANPELPADVRNHYINMATTARDHQYNVIASMMRAGGVAW